MYSKELEELIEVALNDGVLTDKARNVLYKRAQSENIDLDEFEMVLENRLAKIKKIQGISEIPAQPIQTNTQSNKYGDVRKCPNCGSIVEAGEIKCKECNYTFMNAEGNRSVQRFSDMLLEIERRHQINGNGVNNFMKGFGKSIGLYENSREDEIITTIDTFPIPTTKEDLIEFICFLKPKSERNNSKNLLFSFKNEDKIRDAYQAKYKECLTKAKIFLDEDPHFEKLLLQNGIELIPKKKKFGLF